MDFTGCDKLTDISSLDPAFFDLKSLRYVELIFRGCEALDEVASLRWGFAELNDLDVFSLDLNGCAQLPNTLQTSFSSLEFFLRVAVDQCGIQGESTSSDGSSASSATEDTGQPQPRIGKRLGRTSRSSTKKPMSC